MYLSELQSVVLYLNEKSSPSIVNNVYRSRGGTLIKLYGCETTGLFFSERRRVLFPVSDFKLFPKEKITNLEESLRKYLKNRRITGISLLEDYGKAIEIKFGERSLIIPLFGSVPIHIVDRGDESVWPFGDVPSLEKLADKMNFIEPKVKDSLEWQSIFARECDEEIARKKQAILDKSIKHLKKKSAVLRKELESAVQKSAEFGATAQLLKANLYMLKPETKCESVELYNFSGDRETVFLDASLSVLENMNRYFEKAKKFKRGIEKTGSVLKAVLDELQKAQERVPDDIMIEKGARKGREEKLSGRHRIYRKFVTSRGRVFLVGKSSSDNDELSFKIASPHDLWFHAKDYSGSHVIMKKGKSEIVNQNDLITGASLAIHYSKAKKGMEGEVWYTERKNIRKKKGMAPGKVLITRGKSIYVIVNHGFLDKLDVE